MLSIRSVSLLGGTLLIAAFTMVPRAAADDAQAAQILKLQDRVDALEERLAELEKLVQAGNASSAALQARKAQQVAARKRMTHDHRKYTEAQLAEAEQLYQVANKNWRSPQARQNLEQMISRFPDINRTGCAVLYLAQWAQGPDKERLLQDAIQKYGDCYYGDGVQVGAYARLLLGYHYRETGDRQKANAIFGELKREFPEAVDHEGELLSVRMDQN